MISAPKTDIATKNRTRVFLTFSCVGQSLVRSLFRSLPKEKSLQELFCKHSAFCLFVGQLTKCKQNSLELGYLIRSVVAKLFWKDTSCIAIFASAVLILDLWAQASLIKIARGNSLLVFKKTIPCHLKSIKLARAGQPQNEIAKALEAHMAPVGFLTTERRLPERHYGNRKFSLKLVANCSKIQLGSTIIPL